MGHAQERVDESPAWTVQTDPLTAALGIAQVLFERRLSNQVAVYLGPSLRLYDSPLLPDEEEGHRAYGVEFGARWFLSGTAPRGWWVGVRGVIARVEVDDETEPGGYVSALAGKAWIFDDRWVVSVALGVSWFDYGIGDIGTSGFLPAAHTGVGFAF